MGGTGQRTRRLTPLRMASHLYRTVDRDPYGEVAGEVVLEQRGWGVLERVFAIPPEEAEVLRDWLIEEFPLAERPDPEPEQDDDFGTDLADVLARLLKKLDL